MSMAENTRIYSLVITTYYLGDLWPLLQGQTKVVTLKVLKLYLLLVREVMHMKPSYRKSWAGILLMWSYLT